MDEFTVWPPDPGPLGLKAAAMTRAVAGLAAKGTNRQVAARRGMVGADLAELREDVVAMADRLTKEDEWLLAHPRHRDYSPSEDGWLGRLWDYEAACDAITAAQKEVVG